MHTPITGAAVFGGVAMGPQEKAFRSGVDILVATPGRLLDHFQQPTRKLDGLEILVLDEADRMLDMGFLPDIRRVLRHLPRPEPDALLLGHHAAADRRAVAARCCASPARLNVERKSAPATGITQAVYPVPQDAEARPAAWSCCGAGRSRTCSSSPAPSTARTAWPSSWTRHGVSCDRIHGNRSQAQRTDALAGFKSGTLRVLVATDIAARGIDVEALVARHQLRRAQHARGLHPPRRPHRPRGDGGRRLHLRLRGGDGELHAIERAVGSRLPRRTVEGFDYQAKPAERFEIPLQERIAAIRARRAEERARAKAKAEKKAQREAEEKARLDEKARRRAEGRPAEHQPRPQGQGGHRQPRQEKQPAQQRHANQPERGNRAAEAPSHLGRQQPPRRKDFQRRGRHAVVPEPVVQREVDPTTKPTEERLSQIRSAFSPARFNRFRR